MGERVGSEGVDVASAARQLSWQFLVIAGIAVLEVVAQPGREALVLAAALFTALALGTSLVPTRRWGPRTLLASTVLLLGCLGLSTWCADDRAVVTGPGFVIAFVWMGLHQSPRAILLCLPIAALSYGLALHLAGTPAELSVTAVVMVPVAAVLGMVVAGVVAQARRANAAVTADERWRAAVMATLAHDVRSPLTSVISALEILSEDDETPARRRHLLDIATRQTLRILRLSTGLLELERVDQGRLTLRRSQVALADLLRDVAAALPAVPFEVDVPPGLSAWVDRERLEQVLVNLLNNAAGYGDPPLVVSAAGGPAGVTVSVRDHGAGIADEDVPHLFERFTAAGRSPGSVGLGLWIVRLLTEAHGGSVGYRPAHPGAEFFVRLPHAAAADLPPAARLHPQGSSAS